MKNFINKNRSHLLICLSLKTHKSFIILSSFSSSSSLHSVFISSLYFANSVSLYLDNCCVSVNDIFEELFNLYDCFLYDYMLF